MDPRIDWPNEYREYFRLFNERDFFEAHEVLEDLWVVEVPPLRNYYKGLIQAAVALCHWERGNQAAARRLWLLARGYLKPYPVVTEGFQLAAFLRDMEALFAPLIDSPGSPTPPPARSAMPVLQLAEPA